VQEVAKSRDGPQFGKGGPVAHASDVDQTPQAEPSPSVADTGEQKDELGEEALDKVAGGLMGGDDDLEDLEVERLGRR
jgi:hypothetical protein